MKVIVDVGDLRACENARAEYLANIQARLAWALEQLGAAIPPPELSDGDASVCAARLESIGRELLTLGALVTAHASAYQVLARVDRWSKALPENGGKRAK